MYKVARNQAWRTLLDCGITRLPVELGLVAKHYNIDISLYSESEVVGVLQLEQVSRDGFSVQEEESILVYLNDRVHDRHRRRFTLAHELGHVIMGHDLVEARARTLSVNEQVSFNENPLEMQANVFARDLLMPAIVLHMLDAITPHQIMHYCHVSEVSAKIRADRLALLREREAWMTHPLERQVYEQFRPFIGQFKGRIP